MWIPSLQPPHAFVGEEEIFSAPRGSSAWWKNDIGVRQINRREKV